MGAAEENSRELWACHLGVVPYREAVEIQAELRARRQADELGDLLLLLEHPPVYTVGRRAGAGTPQGGTSELPFPREFYEQRGVEIHETDRGGRVTYHGPGQLVGYPIMAVSDVIEHLRTMEGAIVSALDEVGVKARGRVQDGPDYTGVWVEDRKIASLGVHLSRGISTHGFAVNVENDLEPFSWVVACGLPDVHMTSLAAEVGAGAERLACFRKRIAHTFCQAQGRRQRLVSPRRLGIGTAPHDSGGPEGPEPIRTVMPAHEKVPAYPMAGRT
jgi:lipoate-protein ligase B